MDTAELEVQNYSKKGHGLALLPKQGSTPQVIEIAHAVKGDLLRVELMRKRKRKKKGKLLEVVKPSNDRVEPKCAHATICGGCTWQQVSYEAQLKVKQRKIEELFQSSVEENASFIKPIIKAEDPWHYRNKMEFSFSENRAGTKFLGLMIAQGASYVFNVTECHIAPTWYAKALNAVRAWWETSDITAFNFRDGSGTLRTLTLREGKRTGQKLAMLTISGTADESFTKSKILGFQNAIQEALPNEEISFYLRVQQTAKGMKTQFYDMHLSGADHLAEKLIISTADQDIELQCKVSPTSFFQPNPAQAEKLYAAAFSLLGDEKEECIYDLYSGTGTLSMISSFFAKKVIGIELHPESVFDAEDNLKLNAVSNVTFYQGDVGQVITKLRAESGFITPSLVIVDPPRAGLDDLAMHHLKTLSPNRILYISCNPETQADNIQHLSQLGYRIVTVQPVDQFPHTAHIENIVLLEK